MLTARLSVASGIETIPDNHEEEDTVIITELEGAPNLHC